MRSFKRAAIFMVPVLLAACATEPMGPTIAVMPAPGKPFDQFQYEEATCKSYASDQVRGAAQQANNQAVGTAVVGTALGAGVGALLGGGRGAAAGAGIGAVGGTAVGASGSQQSQYNIQQRYNTAYAQCMYAKGNQVPSYYPPPRPGYPPPPPPGYAPGYPPPPPPPGYYR